jgi:hypothetical protein
MVNIHNSLFILNIIYIIGICPSQIDYFGLFFATLFIFIFIFGFVVCPKTITMQRSTIEPDSP